MKYWSRPSGCQRRLPSRLLYFGVVRTGGDVSPPISGDNKLSSYCAQVQSVHPYISLSCIIAEGWGQHDAIDRLLTGESLRRARTCALEFCDSSNLTWPSVEMCIMCNNVLLREKGKMCLSKVLENSPHRSPNAWLAHCCALYLYILYIYLYYIFIYIYIFIYSFHPIFNDSPSSFL